MTARGAESAPATHLLLPERMRDGLGGVSGQVRWYPAIESMPALADDAEAVWAMGYLSADTAGELLERAPDLRWLHYSSTGVEHLPLGTFAERSILVTNGAGLYAAPIAEHVVMCLLAARRNLRALFEAQARGAWSPEAESDAELGGASVLILGYGQLGRAIAKRLSGFGVTVLAARRSGPVVDDEHAADAGDWRERLPEVDFLILTLPSTAETRGIVGRAELAAMKPGAWVVNVARGSLVDEEALVGALASDSLGGAILDAFATEPLPAAHPLWQFENVILSPHSSWKSSKLPGRDLALFLENLRRFQAGDGLRNLVDAVAGY